MLTMLTRKLAQYADLTARDRQSLANLAGIRALHIEAREDLIGEGAVPAFAKFVVEGWAARYKMLENGRRQIAGFLLPGDLCVRPTPIAMRLDHAIGAISPLRCAMVPPETLDALEQKSANIRRALAADAQIALSVQREWTVNLGARAAPERIGCLVCELYLRLRAVGMTQADGYFCPLTQVDLAAAAGISAVHVNRVIKQMRRDGLIRWREQFIEIPDLQGLAQACGFRAHYLHMTL